MLIAIQNEREWAEFCARFLDEPDLPQRAGFETNVSRVANRPVVDAHIAAVFARLTRDEAAAKLRAANTAYGFVNDVAALAHHPALRRATVETPNGEVAIGRAAGAVQRRRAGAGPGAGDRRALGRDPRRIRRLRLAAEAAWRRLEGERRSAPPDRRPGCARVASRRRPSAA